MFTSYVFAHVNYEFVLEKVYVCAEKNKKQKEGSSFCSSR